MNVLALLFSNVIFLLLLYAAPLLGLTLPSALTTAAGAVSAIADFHLAGFVMFAAVMRLQMVRDEGKLSATQTALGEVTLGIGLAWDVVMNLFATVWLLQLPWKRTQGGGPTADLTTVRGRLVAFLFHRTWLLSSRLEQNVFHSNARWAWQKRVSERFRTAFLDNIDPRGIHRS